MALRDDYEIAEQASVRELYHFYIGDGSWFDYKYTNRDTDWVDLVIPSIIYKSLQLTRNGIKQTISAISNTIDLTVPKDTPLAQAYVSIPPHGGVNVDIAVGYDEDQGAITDPENLIFWKGVVTNVKFSGNTAVVTCETKFKVLDRLALRRRATMHCPYALYSAECGVGKAGAERNGTVLSIPSATTLVVKETQKGGGIWQNLNLDAIYDFANHYSGGFILYAREHDDSVFRVGIISAAYQANLGGFDSQISIVLEQSLPGLLLGSLLSLFPGCARNVLHCHYKFSNYNNFGGVPHMTTDEPFSDAFRTPLN